MLLVLAGIQVAYAGLSFVSTAVPDHAIIARLADDVHEGRLGSDYDKFPLGGTRDGFTECIGATLGVDPAHPSVLHRTIRNPQQEGCPPTVRAVTAWDHGQPAPARAYWRYWHGYTVVSRPAIALGGLTGARIVVALALAAAAYLFVRTFARRIGWTPAVLLLVPSAIAGDLLFSPMSFPHGLSLAVALAGAAAMLRWGERRWWPVIAMAAGSAYAFVDLLTNPPLALLWCLVAVAVTCLRRADGLVGTCVRLAGTGVCWVFGWATTWICKWVSVMPAIGVRRVLDDIVHQAELRSSNADAPRFDYGFGQQTLRNLNAWFDLVTAPYVGAVVLIALVIAFGMLLVRDRAAAVALLPLLLVTLLVPAWYEGLRNHSSQHAFFVYRALPGAVGVLAAVAWLAGRRVLSLRRG